MDIDSPRTEPATKMGSLTPKPRRCQCRLPTVSFLALAAVVSTALSLLGGYLLYLEALNGIEDAAEDIGLAESTSAAAAVTMTMSDAIWILGAMGKMLAPRAATADVEGFAGLAFSFQHSLLSGTRSLVGLGAEVQPLAAGRENRGLRQESWWEPLTQTDHIAASNGSGRMLYMGTGEPGYADLPCVDGQLAMNDHRCTFAWQVNQEGGILSNPYNFSVPVRQDTHSLLGETFWGAVSSRVATVGNTKYWYLPRYQFHSVVRHEVFGDSVLVFFVYVMVTEWESILRNVPCSGIMVIADLLQGMAGGVYGSTV
eukprot:Hpha_TRINITY_DN20182_c0_g1::TRINITY_DN20182_c0_g1_i1::g.82568::m.82568